ncbi:flagellar hook-length control protein FliK [Ideonella oryzae]|uniref:Flagellar hook-length control protein FliK n=1 Tax=Ideonella oryzae TaxID=2937441 RepID=A0ABT1BLI1_9BURK|nr:flagellar hook-length control protein FliK [Ideonella oryzae]MCO5977070.1 flagellar hook-length control protein FliK [Ideonella oryzae]
MNVASAAAPSGSRATPDAATLGLPADTPPASPTEAGAPEAPAAGFQQALQQAQDRAKAPADASTSPESLDFARWLNAPMASPGEAAAGPDACAATSSPATAPDEAPAQAPAQDSPALRLDWTQLPAAVVAALADPATLRAAGSNAGPVTVASSRGSAVPPALPGNSPRPVARTETPQALVQQLTDTAASTTPPAGSPAPATPAAASAPALVTDADADSATASVPAPAPGSAPAPLLQADAAPAASGLTAPDVPGHPLRAHSPQALREALGERLSWQVDQRSEQATIRLSPERLGHIDIQIRHEAGGLQVQLAASHGEVVRQLQQVSEGLRQDLGLRHGGDISVQVAERREGASLGEGGGRQQQGRSSEEQQPGRALAETDADDSTRFALA